MSEIERLRERVVAARDGVRALRPAGWGEPGPLDPETGERWDRGNVLGHIAELLPYWTAQVRAVLGGVPDIGRDAEGWAQRQEAVDHLREVGEEPLLRRIDAGLEGLVDLLSDMREADLDRRVTYHGQAGDHEVELRDAVETRLVAHLEAHLRQLEELGG